ncbi:MAG: transketolase-like TK C-terminal-containing protein [Actinomycetota bacterium]
MMTSSPGCIAGESSTPRWLVPKVTLLFSGSAHGAVTAAARTLADEHGVSCDVWSATSYKVLREDALAAERQNRLAPGRTSRPSRVGAALRDSTAPIVAVTDFMKIVPEQVARFVPGRRFVPLGTDGMGRSDTREALRAHFEIDSANVVVAALAALAADGTIPDAVVRSAIEAHGLDPERVDPYVV